MSFDAPPFAPIGVVAPRVPISFELYPPRTPAPVEALHETIQQLASVTPRFISVTYGAGGSVGAARSTCCATSASTPRSSRWRTSPASAARTPGPPG